MKLSRSDVVKSQKEIAQSLEITQAAMTVSLSKLEKDGLIIRSVGKDSRYNEISVTELGREIVERSRSHFSNVDSKTFEGISEDELKVFEHCLDIMSENLKKITEKEGK
jgi:DNA-binding MarR family transcriptional regulator